jgi:hypothetical protein
MEKQIRFRDLSIPLKIVVCFSWVTLVIYGLAFLIGFISAFI